MKKNNCIIEFMFIFKVGPYSGFLLLESWFFFLLKFLSYVTNICLNRILSVPESQEDVYTIFVCPFQPQLVFSWMCSKQ